MVSDLLVEPLMHRGDHHRISTFAVMRRRGPRLAGFLGLWLVGGLSEVPPVARTPDLRWPRPPGRMPPCRLLTLPSSLLLHDHDPLTVTALMHLRLADADLAFLSACSTTQTSHALADEAVHLTAAVHLAGYRHVIGTLWPINDTAAVRIAIGVYTRLTNDGTQATCPEDSAYALAEATLDERDAYPALPIRWATHLHLGP